MRENLSKVKFIKNAKNVAGVHTHTHVVLKV